MTVGGSRYALRDYSDEDGTDIEIIEILGDEEYGVGRHDNLADAERQLADLRWIERIDR